MIHIPKIIPVRWGALFNCDTATENVTAASRMTQIINALEPVILS